MVLRTRSKKERLESGKESGGPELLPAVVTPSRRLITGRPAVSAEKPSLSPKVYRAGT